MAESMIGLFKAEVIYARGPWRNPEVVEYSTLEWVHNEHQLARRAQYEDSSMRIREGLAGHVGTRAQNI